MGFKLTILFLFITRLLAAQESAPEGFLEWKIKNGYK
jgi:hypothetical protein